MDRTSFIPKKTFKKPVYKTKGVGFLLGFSLLLFVVSGLFSGGVFFYKEVLKRQVAVLEDSLKRAHAGFEPELVKELMNVSEKVKAAKILLKEHKALTPIFDFLKERTLKKVRFFSFDYKLSKEGEPIISMKGVAKGYAPLALQIDEFQKSEELKDISVSKLSLMNDGKVSFILDLVFNPKFISYKVK